MAAFFLIGDFPLLRDGQMYGDASVEFADESKQVIRKVGAITWKCTFGQLSINATNINSNCISWLIAINISMG